MKFVQINTMAEYRQFLDGHKIINNGFTPQEMQKYMGRGALFGSNPDAPVFFYDENAYYQMCFSEVNAGVLSEILAGIDKTTIAYIRDDCKQTEPVIHLRNLLEQVGFTELQTFNELELKIDGNFVEPEHISALGLRNIDSWCEDDYIQVLELWKNNIPIYDLPFVTIEDVEAYANAGRLIALEDIASGRIVAVICFENLLGRKLTRHFVVDEMYRGRGLGSVVMRQMLVEAQKGARKAWAWVAETNIASRKVYEKNGFHVTPIKMYQYILRRD